ncbi:quinolinate synthase NadA [Desulfonatronovibrio hydrogenovorans]|uniref:quinolinate synthase NadA n=1 Tax=Desulfonatronovibrio hydrogenovorans TaxID=53245 RepID=UPI00048E0D07|nr:quinolinate synthase NadA [Desulfonatronovibrio hydrogenovorans]
MHNEQIRLLKKKYGSDLAILAHHYQNDSIVEHADLVGDSLQLAAAIPDLKARYIVFCGVDFMAETAVVLARPGQLVFSPDPGATCVMADMAPGSLVSTILEKLNSHQKVVPLAYVNSSVEIKALCGHYGGSVCTSSNASRMLEWALDRGDKVLFLPDKNLGRNTAAKAGLDKKSIEILDVRQGGRLIDPMTLSRKKLLLWPGVCAVHFRLKKDHVATVTSQEPQARIVVHPECHPLVVDKAHEAGSTSRIIAFVRDADPGTTIYIGTEDNLVLRLKSRFPDKNIFPLGAGYCSNMAKINLANLCACLENLDPKQAVRISRDLIPNARKAVQTMLEVST